VILVDTNVLLDVFQADPRWADWSERQLEAASFRAKQCINPIVYAEASVTYQENERYEAAIRVLGLAVVETPREALFLAGKAYLQYRRRRGGRSGVLPDFLIGAHAAVTGVPILTRDAGRYRTYFPGVELIGVP
jgi:predicted nucleic acid-binding protein